MPVPTKSSLRGWGGAERVKGTTDTETQCSLRCKMGLFEQPFKQRIRVVLSYITKLVWLECFERGSALTTSHCSHNTNVDVTWLTFLAQ